MLSLFPFHLSTNVLLFLAPYNLLLFPQHLITLLTKMLSQITLISLLGAAMILMLATVSCLQLHFNEALTNYLFHSLPFPFLLHRPRTGMK